MGCVTGSLRPSVPRGEVWGWEMHWDPTDNSIRAESAEVLAPLWEMPASSSVTLRTALGKSAKGRRPSPLSRTVCKTPTAGRTVETAQWLKCLLCKLEDLSSNPPEPMQVRGAEHGGACL